MTLHLAKNFQTTTMARVTGIGGIFFKCKDSEKVKNWYQENLGLPTDQYGWNFEWRDNSQPEKKGSTQWSPFKDTTTYFAPSEKQFMINYRVEDLDGLLEQLKRNGVTIIGDVQSFSYGKFAHIMDPEGNKIELWEPSEEGFD